MPHYRVHFLDPHGELLGAVEVDCTDDEAAKERTDQVLGATAESLGDVWSCSSRTIYLFRQAIKG